MISGTPPDALFFDVDGVLIDSLQIKGEAFAYTFNDFPNSRRAVLDFHLANGGITRSQKISMIYRLLAGVEASQEEIQKRSARFGDNVQQRVVAAAEIPGANAALRRWALACPLYAVSATPDREISNVLTARGIESYFRGIHGWPPPKDRVISGIVNQQGYDANRCVLVGDSQEDLLASRSAGVRFVHVRAPATKVLLGGHPTISDLHDLDSAITMALT